MKELYTLAELRTGDIVRHTSMSKKNVYFKKDLGETMLISSKDTCLVISPFAYCDGIEWGTAILQVNGVVVHYFTNSNAYKKLWKKIV